MTVPTTINRAGPYDGNGVTTEFDYEFTLHDPEHLIVTLETDDGPIPQTLDVDYTITGIGSAEGGQFIFVVPPAAGQHPFAVRTVPTTQETELENQGPYFAKTIETALDLVTMMLQQMDTRLVDAEAEFRDIDESVAAAAESADASEASRAGAQQILENILTFDQMPVASNVGFTPPDGMNATNAQAAIEEVGAGLGDHVGKASGAHDAAAISVAPEGGIESTNAQSALAELDAKKALVNPRVNIQPGTDYTLLLADMGGSVVMTSDDDNALTVPAAAAVAYPVGAIIHVLRTGLGVTTIVAGAGVTINGVPGGAGPIMTQWQGATLYCLGNDTWVASGDVGEFS